MVPLCLERVVVSVFDMPARPGTGRKILEDLRGDRMGGRPRVIEDPLSRVFVGDLEREPVDPKGVLLAGEGGPVHEAIGVEETFLLSDPLLMTLEHHGRAALEIL
jgi:hypothetical protein